MHHGPPPGYARHLDHGSLGSRERPAAREVRALGPPRRRARPADVVCPNGPGDPGVPKEGGPSLGQALSKGQETSPFRASAVLHVGVGNRGEPGKNPVKTHFSNPGNTPSAHLWPSIFSGGGPNPQSGPPSGEVTPDPTESVVERALAVALEAAIGAQRWDLALEVTREPGERRRTRTAPSVPSLADARRKKDEGK